ncbi:hypothetical protein JCM5350_005187 [Sporobolomyces pararoseus]
MPPPIRLPSNSRSAASQFFSKLRQIKGFSDLHRFIWFSLPLSPNLPLRIRPFFLLTTFLTLLLLSLLGFHPTLATRLAPPSVPFSDKVLHFVCFALATAGFYRIWKVQDEARKAWVGWRMFNEIVTFAVCCIVGGIFSEIVQSLLPYKTFQFGDVFANLLGSGLALWWSWKRAREDRRDKELRRLYTRMDQFDDDENSDLDDDEQEDRQGLIGGRSPSVRAMRTPRIGGQQDHRPAGGAGASGAGREREMEEGRIPSTSSTRNNKRLQQDNPWDDRDDEEEDREIFGLGDEDDH